MRNTHNGGLEPQAIDIGELKFLAGVYRRLGGLPYDIRGIRSDKFREWLRERYNITVPKTNAK